MEEYFRKRVLTVGVTIILVEIVVLAMVGSFYMWSISNAIDERVESQVRIPGQLMNAGLLDFDAVQSSNQMSELVGDEFIDGMIIGVDYNVYYSLNPEYLGQSAEDIPTLDTSLLDVQNPSDVLLHTNGTLVSVSLIYSVDGVTPRFFVYVVVGTSAASAEKAQSAQLFLLGSGTVVVLTLIIVTLSINLIQKLELSITERERAEGAVRESETKYRLLAENTFDCVWQMDLNTEFTYVNPAIFRVFGFAPEEWIGSSVSEYCSPEVMELLSDLMMETIRQGPNAIPVTFETRMLRKDGKEIDVEITAELILDEDTNPLLFQGTTRDITERKKAGDDLTTAAETAMLYLDLMGHDIRNQLQAIIMGTEILEQLDTRPEVRDVVDIIGSSVENSQSLIKKIQVTRGLLSTPLSSTPLREALEDCLQVLNETYDDVQIEVNLGTQQPTVIADKYLGNLLMNILENAILHNDRKTRRVWLDLREVEGGYEVVIADNGPGILDERKGSLFNQDRRFGGVGVHQALKIARKYGGHITVHDRVPNDSSKGAEFHIWFPKSTP